MIIDFLILNNTNLYSFIIVLSIFILNDKLLYYILTLDIILNGFPFITILIIFLNKFIIYIFKYIK
ncbi:MAG TPA: hypothetical protein GX713_01900, partial [Mollicutes bacterium]|nr:hypothetical protein [Mollicutes bacterium]